MNKKNYVLVVNGGSSSLKFGLYDSVSLEMELSGAVTHIGAEKGHMEITCQQHIIFNDDNNAYKDVTEGARALIDWLTKNAYHSLITSIGHRLVQGGPDHRQPELITPDLLKSLDEFIYLAPNHLPDELKTITVFQAAFPDIPQVACFDTAFHQDMPPQAKYYPLPEKYRDDGLIRYGFHGLSYEFILHRLTEIGPDIHQQKIIIAHLGNGASMAAVQNGISIDTTMGLSPIGGLVMGTRSGDIDPGVILFLLKQDKMTANQLDNLLNKQSGLKAIAGISDVQKLLKTEKNDAKAAEAITLFCYSAKKFIGALAAAMGGLDILVFTGGIGENSAIIRERICRDMEFLGIKIDKKLNQDAKEVISSKSSRLKVMVLKTNEEWIIANHTQKLLKLKRWNQK